MKKPKQLSGENVYILQSILRQLSKVSTDEDALDTLFCALGVVVDTLYELDEIALGEDIVTMGLDRLTVTIKRSEYSSIDQAIEEMTEQETASITNNLLH